MNTLLLVVMLLLFIACYRSEIKRLNTTDEDTCASIYKKAKKCGFLGDLEKEHDLVRQYIRNGLLSNNGWDTYMALRETLYPEVTPE